MMKKKYLLLAFVMFLAMICFDTGSVNAAAGEMNIYSIYLGPNEINAGDATLVESNGEYLLMDLGPAQSYEYVRDFLKARGVQHLSVYFSHTHADHTGGLKKGEGYDRLLGDFAVDRVYVPDKTIGSKVDLSWNHSAFVERYQEHYPAANISQAIQYLNVGSSFTFGDVSVNVIGPVGMANKNVSDYKAGVDQDEAENIYLNNCSLVSRLVCGQTTYLTGGDIDTDEENMLVKTYGSGLKADIYKMSHHGYANSNTEAFIKCVQPDYTFAPNSGAAAAMTSKNTTNQRKVYSAMDRCSRYGFVYLVGSEQQSVAFKSGGGITRVYRTNDMNHYLDGFVQVAGADGADEKYDRYLLGADGKTMKGIQSVDGKKYYFGDGGRQEYGYYLASGYNPWRKYSDDGTDKYRYYDKNTHEMKTGWVKVSKSKIYYCDPDTGFRVKGFVTIDKKRYYFGNACTLMMNKWTTYKGKKYYTNSKGVLCTGWTKIKGEKVYFNTDGARAKGLTKIGSKYYYFNNTGSAKKTNYTVKVDGVVLKFNAKGVLTNVPTSKKTSITKALPAGTNATVSWKRVSKADGYVVYISTNAKKGYTKAADVKKTKNIAKLSNLAPGTYYAKVSSYRKIGGIKFYSKQSAAKEFVIE